MAVLLILFVILLILVLNGVYQKKTNGVCKANKNLNGKTALVTGGTAGMGLEIAIEFARRGARVIIACPFKDEGENAERQIRDVTGNQNVIFKLLDLSSLSSTRDFAADIIKNEDRLDLLINNAGVGTAVPLSSKMYDGANFIMRVNYFGHFLLTNLLLPLLKKSGADTEPSRIINTASFTHHYGNSKSENFNIGCSNLWNRLRSYCNSKYCAVLFAHALSKKLSGFNVVVNAVDPGIVGTRIYKSWNIFGGAILMYYAYYCFKTPREGAQTALHVALEENAGRTTGQLFKNCKLSRAKASAYDDMLGEKLWQDSAKIVKLDVD